MHKIKLLSLLAATAIFSVVIGGSVTATSHDNRPVFNHKTDVTFVVDDDGNQENRDEADFLRFGFRGEQGNGDDIDFCSDQTLDLWFYIHNGTSEGQNNAAGDWRSGDTDNDDPFWNADNSTLDGPSVAHNTTVKLDFSDEATNSHVVTASIKSDESNEVTDSVQITCLSDETKQISLEYVEEETLLSTRAPEHGTLGTIDLVGDLASDSGAVLGYGDGIVPSCFEFASVIRGQLKLIVTEDTELVDDPETDPEDPDDTPEAEEPEAEAEDEAEAEPEAEAEDEPEAEPEAEAEDEPEEEDAPDIPPLGAGAVPLAAIVLSSAVGAVGAVGYRAIQSTRRK